MVWRSWLQILPTAWNGFEVIGKINGVSESMPSGDSVFGGYRLMPGM